MVHNEDERALLLKFFFGRARLGRDMKESLHTFLRDESFLAIKAFDGSIAEYCRVFMEYCLGYLDGNASTDRHLTLKIQHTLRVLSKAWRITAGERQVSLRRAALLAALFHDVGRFEQFSRFGTFSDALSVNHGILGAQVLQREGFLASEPPSLKQLIKAVVLLHNRQQIPHGLDRNTLFPLKVVRDADKLDILRVMAGFLGVGCEPDDTILLHLKDEPSAISPSFLSFGYTSQPLAYLSMRYVNDFRVLLVSWMGQMNFPQSRDIALEEGHVFTIAEGLQGVPAAREKAYVFLAEHGKSKAS